MIKPPLDELLKNTNNRFALVHLVIKRAIELDRKKEDGEGGPLIENPINVALREVSYGKVKSQIATEKVKVSPKNNKE